MEVRRERIKFAICLSKECMLTAEIALQRLSTSFSSVFYKREKLDIEAVFDCRFFLKVVWCSFEVNHG